MVMVWHVVVFVDEERVEVVPKCWLINNNLCYWPNAKKHFIASLIKSCSLPEKETWDVVKIRLLGTNKVYDDYTQASNAATKACYKSDISSSETDITGKKLLTLNSSKGRAIKQNKRYLSSDDEGDSSDVSHTSSLLSVPVKGNCNSFIQQEEADVPDDESENIKKKAREKNHGKIMQISRNLVVQKQADPSTPVTTKNTQSSNNEEDTLQKICTRISYLTLLMKGAIDDIAYIKEHITLGAVSQPTSSDINVMEDDSFPFNNVETLEEFDKTLLEKENYLKIVKFMSRIGGETPYDFVKRVMGRILTDDLASQFSFTGHKGKKPFGAYHLTKALKDASKNINKLKDCTEVDIEKKLKDWLRHAPARTKRERVEDAGAAETNN